MDPDTLVDALKRNIVAVIRMQDTKLAKLVTEEAIRNKMNIIELTLTIPDAHLLIQEIKQKFPDAYIGAGTVLSIEDAEKVIQHGADFIVSPCMIPDVIELCVRKNIICLPGIATPTEAFNAYKMGCKIVKVFPGDTLGPKFIKNVKAPLPFIECMPSGGVSEENISDWFQCGAYAVSIGSALYEGISEENLAVMNDRIKRYFSNIPS